VAQRGVRRADVAVALELGVEADRDVAAGEQEALVEAAELVVDLAPDGEARAGDGEDVAVPAGVAEQARRPGGHALEDVVGEPAEPEDRTRVLQLAVGADELQPGDADLGPAGPSRRSRSSRTGRAPRCRR
jgi:hypothetical protein